MKKTLSSNHPSVATSYSNIACAFRNMTDYKKALEYYECALDICQRSLPPNHPDTQKVKDRIETVKNEL